MLPSRRFHVRTAKPPSIFHDRPGSNGGMALSLDHPPRRPARGTALRFTMLKLGFLLFLAVATPGLPLRSLAVLCGLAGAVTGVDALLDGERPGGTGWTRWDEALSFLLVAGLGWRFL